MTQYVDDKAEAYELLKELKPYMDLAPIVKILPLALEDSQYCLDTIF